MPIDYKKYPATWLRKIRPRILERAQYCCEECGLEESSTVYSVKFWIKDSDGRYKVRCIWFRNFKDATREAGEHSIVNYVKVVLTIAHLDHDEENHEITDDRLKALCQACHLRYDAKEKYRRIIEKGKEAVRLRKLQQQNMNNADLHR